MRILLGIFVLGGLAYAAPEAPLVSITQQGTQTPAPVQNARWEWHREGGAIPSVYLDLLFALPKKASAVEAPHSRVRILPPGNSVSLHLASTQEDITVKYADGSSGVFRAAMELKSLVVLERDCFKGNLTIRGTRTLKKPFFLGVSCQKSDDSATTLAITIPADLTWGATNIFERRGKGEPVREFALELQVSGNRATSSLVFDVLTGMEKARFEIASKNPYTTETTHERKKTLRASMALGAWSMALKTPAIDQAKILPALTAELDFSVWITRLGFLGKFVLPLPPSDTNISFYSAQFYVAVPLESGRWSFVPRVLFETIGIDHNPPTLTFSFRQASVGAGLAIRYRLTDTESALTFQAQEWGFLPASQGTNLVLALGYDFGQTGVFQYGLQAFYQRQAYDAGAGLRSLTMLGLNGVLRF